VEFHQAFTQLKNSAFQGDVKHCLYFGHAVSVNLCFDFYKHRKEPIYIKVASFNGVPQAFLGVQLLQTAPLVPSLNANRIIFLRFVFPTTRYVPAVPPQTKSSFSSNFLLHFGRMPCLRFCQPRQSFQHKSMSLWKCFGECSVSTVLTATCYWPSSHCIPTQNLCPCREI